MRTRSRSKHRGFALVELLVVLMMIGIIAAIVVPAFQRIIHRSRVMSAMSRVTSTLQIARLEAVRRGVPAVVAFDVDSGDLVAFADIDGTVAGSPPDGLFNPIDPAPPRGTDFEIRRIPIPGALALADPDGNTGSAAFDGLDNPAPLPDGVLIYQPNGSVAATGAFRLSDGRTNYLEVRIAPAASGRTRLRKFNDQWDLNPDDDTHWYARGEVERTWIWD